MAKHRSKSKVVLTVIILLLVAGGGVYGILRYRQNQNDSAKSSTASNSSSGQNMDMMSMHMNSALDSLKGKTGDAFDSAFLIAMTEHHAGAVEMAGYVAFDAKHAEIRALASSIKLDQQAEIEQMREWARAWNYKFAEPNQANVQMMAQSLGGKQGDELDKQFITDMSIHHQGAIDMAQLALTNAGHQELKDFAQKIIDAQTKEMADMNNWAAQWGYNLEDNPNNPHSSM
jgi:uncharacterized protein (DUF305 family)